MSAPSGLRIQASTRDEWRAVGFFGCGGVPGCGQVLWRGAGKTSPECHVPASKPTCNHSRGLSLSSSTFPFITLVAADLYGTGLSRDNRVEVISKVDAYFGLPAVASDYASRNLFPFKSLCRDGSPGSQFESP